MELPFFNAFRAKVLRQRLDKLFPSAYIESLARDKRVLHKHLSEEERAALELKKDKEIEEQNRIWRAQMRSKVGFRRIWTLIKVRIFDCVALNFRL